MPVRVAPAPRGTLYRIGRAPDPLDWPPPAFAGRNRFDDPRGEFVVLYAAEQRRGSFVEKLDAYRPTTALLQRLLAFGAEGFVPRSGQIPDDFFANQLLGYSRLGEGQRWLDARLSAPETARALSREPAIAAVLPSLGYGPRVTPGDFVSGDRGLTQATARWAYDHGFQGIVYSSSHDPHNLDCWAIFEGSSFRSAGAATRIDRDDPDLIAVATEFELTITFTDRGR